MTTPSDHQALIAAMHSDALDVAAMIAVGQLTESRWVSYLDGEVGTNLSAVATRSGRLGVSRAAACEALSLARWRGPALALGRATKSVAVMEFRAGDLDSAEWLVECGVASLLASLLTTG